MTVNHYLRIPSVPRGALLLALAAGVALTLLSGVRAQRAAADPAYGLVAPNPNGGFIIDGYKFSVPVKFTTSTTRCTSIIHWCNLGAYGVVLNFDNRRLAVNSTTGTSTGSNTTWTLRDTHATWKTNQWAGSSVLLTGGSGSGQERVIASNTACPGTSGTPCALTLTSTWNTTFPNVLPDATTTYRLGGVTDGGWLASTGRPMTCPIGAQYGVSATDSHFSWAELHCVTTGDGTIQGPTGAGNLVNVTFRTVSRGFTSLTFTLAPANPNTQVLTTEGWTIPADISTTGARRVIVCPDANPIPDGKVSATDLQQIALAFGQHPGGLLYSVAKDPDESGTINSADLLATASVFGKTCVQK